jgi:hypothetical protein
VPITEVSDPFDHLAGDRGFENELSTRLHGELRSGKSAPGVKAPGRPSRHAQGGRLPLIPPLSRGPLGPKLPESRSRGTLARAPQWRRCWHTPTRRHFHRRLRASWMNLALPLARPLGTRHRPQRRMSPVWESYCATRSRSSLHSEAPIEPLRERPDQSEARQATVGVLQIEAEPLILHTELI